MARTRLAGTNTQLNKTAAADALNLLKAAKTPAVGVFKLTTGQRLGASSEQERQEGAAVRLAAQKEATELAAKKIQEQQAAKASQLQSLRSSLGIDELINEIQTRMRGAASAGADGAYDFEMPAFEYPEFNYTDEFAYNEGYVNDSSESAPPTNELTNIQSPTTQIPASVTPKATKTNTVKIAGTTYDLTKKGGSGFSTADISYLKNQGLSTSQIIKAASQSSKAPSTGAQKELGISVTQTSGGGFTVQKTPTQVTAAKPSGSSVFFASPAAAKLVPSAAAPTQAKSSASSASKAVAAQFFPTPAAPKAAASSGGGGGGSSSGGGGGGGSSSGGGGGGGGSKGGGGGGSSSGGGGGSKGGGGGSSSGGGGGGGKKK